MDAKAVHDADLQERERGQEWLIASLRKSNAALADDRLRLVAELIDAKRELKAKVEECENIGTMAEFNIAAWQSATGHATPEAYRAAVINPDESTRLGVRSQCCMLCEKTARERDTYKDAAIYNNNRATEHAAEYEKARSALTAIRAEVRGIAARSYTKTCTDGFVHNCLHHGDLSLLGELGRDGT